MKGSNENLEGPKKAARFSIGALADTASTEQEIELLAASQIGVQRAKAIGQRPSVRTKPLLEQLE